MLLSLSLPLPGAPDTLEAEHSTSRVTEIAEIAVADGEIEDLGVT